MGLIVLTDRWKRKPDRLVDLDRSSPLTKGLTAFYLISPGLWQWDLVTKRRIGEIAGTGLIPDGNHMRTPNSANNGAYLPTNFTVTAPPISFVFGAKRLSASGVDWSLLDETKTAATWWGWYQGGTDFSTSQNNSFDGSMSFSTAQEVDRVYQFAVTSRGANDLEGKAFGTSLVADTACQAPNISNTRVTLGWSNKNTPDDDNPSGTLFSYFGIYNRALNKTELSALADNPWQIFLP